MAEAPHRYLSLFVSEATEQLEALGRDLIRLESEPAAGPLWDSIFRRVHSIKGSAATLGLSTIVEISHAAETLVGRVRTSGERPSRAQIDLLFEASDTLGKEVQRVAGQQTQAAPAARASDDLAARLQAAVEGVPLPAPAVAAPAPLAPPPAVDPALPRYDVSISLARNCQAPGARALIVQRKLKALGALLELEPTPQQLMQKKGGVRLSAVLATARPVEEIRKGFGGIPEVEGVEVRLVPAASARTGAVEAASATPAVSGATRMVSDPPPPGEEPRAAEATVRVRAQALDQLLDQASEVLHGIARLREHARKLPETVAPAFETEIDRLRRIARELHGRVMNARLMPFSSLSERMPRAVRDLSHRLGKEVDLEVQGAEVELDRTVIEALGDPLSHLVRNAVDHGLEAPVQRLSAGKGPRGRLVLGARRERDKVLVTVEDDGRGMDANRLRARAVEMGRLDAAQAAALSEPAAFELAFLPGLSTRVETTDVSGRGVGLDAVHAAIAALGGRLSVHSTPGKGTRFAMELPLSVSISNLLLVQVGGELYGLPMNRVMLTTEYDLSARGGEGFEARSLAVLGQLVRAYSLAKLFGLPSLAPPGPRPFAVLDVDGAAFALAVDRLVGQEEAVLRPLFPPLDRVKGLAGTTVLGNGRPLLVLDPRGLFELAESVARTPARGAA